MTLKRTQILFPSERVEKVVSEAKQEYSSVLKDFYTRRNE
jgi:hypothetical protein